MIPNDIKTAIDDYVTNFHEQGYFVMACLRNNFLEAVCRADDNNILHIVDIARYLHNSIPAASWGSTEKVDAWLRGKGKLQRSTG